MWYIHSHYQQSAIAEYISDLDAVFNLQGDLRSSSSISDVIYLTVAGRGYYIKRYYAAGKSLRRYVGRSRVRGEWENLFYFQQNAIPTAHVVAYGEESHYGLFQRGALITEAIPNTIDLAKTPLADSIYWKDFNWRKQVMIQVANYTKRLHEKGFVHCDLKWRNILVTQEDFPKVYFIDCPIGRKRYGCFLRHGRIKDLETLDQLAKKYLTHTMRLRFYKKYCAL